MSKLTDAQRKSVSDYAESMIEAQNKTSANRVKSIGSNYLEENLKNKQLWNDYSKLSEASYGNIKKMMKEIADMQAQTISQEGLSKLFTNTNLIGSKASDSDNQAFSSVLGFLGGKESIEELEKSVVSMLTNINEYKEGSAAIDERISSLSDEQLQKLRLILTLVQYISQSLKGAELNVNTAKTNKLLKDLKSLDSQIGEFIDSVEGIADAFGFAFDESTSDVLNAVKVIGSSVLEVISTVNSLVKSASDGMTAAAGAASKSLSTVEKASVVLAVIGAALQVATAIANIFTGAKTRETDKAIKKETERVEDLTIAYDRLQKTQQERYNLIADQSSIDKWLLMEKRAIDDAASLWSKFFKGRQELINKLYAEAEAQADSMKGSSWLQVEIANIEQQRKALQKAIDTAENDNKKGKRNDEISGYKNQLADLDEQIIDLRNDWNETLRGFDMSSTANDFAEAWVEAFLKGESAMDSFKDKFDEMIKQMVINQAAMRIVSNVLQPWFDQIDSFFGDDGVLSADEASTIASKIPSLLANLDSSMQSVIAPLLEAFGMTYGSDTEKSDSLKEAISGVTEEQANVLVSILGSIRQDVSMQTALIANINTILESGGMGGSSLMLAELQAINTKFDTLISMLSSVVSAGHPKGGNALKVFA